MNISQLTAIQLLYARCPECRRHITWKVHWGGQILGSSCCGQVYNAQPVMDENVFIVTSRSVDRTNLILFPILVDYSPVG